MASSRQTRMSGGQLVLMWIAFLAASLAWPFVMMALLHGGHGMSGSTLLWQMFVVPLALIIYAFAKTWEWFAR